MLQSINRDDLTLLLADHDPPCISLYQPTHRHYPENQQDPIRYKNLLRTVEESLRLRYSNRDTARLLDQFRNLGSDPDFWNHATDGLAVLGAPGLWRVFKLQRPVPELAVVANSFHVKPLLRIVQSAERYQVLSINRQSIRLFEGNRDVLDEIELAPGVPRTITEALGTELTPPHLNVSMSYAARPGAAVRQGQGSKNDESEIDEEKFFRLVDRTILEYHSRPSGLPLLLAGLAQYHGPFHQISKNPLLMHKGIEIDANALTIEQLRQRAWEIVERAFRERLQKLIDEFEEARSKGLGTDDLVGVAKAASEARIESLLVEAGKLIPGRLDQANGRIAYSRLENPEVDDLLDDLAELVTKKGGTVVVLPAVDMPVTTGVAATFRF
ncbi:MAG: hypothetical protein ABJC09_01690 [Terriglobia bacterium]